MRFFGNHDYGDGSIFCGVWSLGGSETIATVVGRVALAGDGSALVVVFFGASQFAGLGVEGWLGDSRISSFVGGGLCVGGGVGLEAVDSRFRVFWFFGVGKSLVELCWVDVGNPCASSIGFDVADWRTTMKSEPSENGADPQLPSPVFPPAAQPIRVEIPKQFRLSEPTLSTPDQDLKATPGSSGHRGPKSKSGVRLLELAGLVAGYSVAAILARMALPGRVLRELDYSMLALLMGEYIWMGLAMSGPLVLALREKGRPWTWAEMAWGLIGGYWFVIAALVAPSRLPQTPWLGFFPIVAALVLRMVAFRSDEKSSPPSNWTHPVALILLMTWPLAWLILMALGSALYQ